MIILLQTLVAFVAALNSSRNVGAGDYEFAVFWGLICLLICAVMIAQAR